MVTEQGTGLSKGVGYVAFALKEDAESAFENISTNGISLVGRKLRVQWADSKVYYDRHLVFTIRLTSPSPKTKERRENHQRRNPNLDLHRDPNIPMTRWQYEPLSYQDFHN